MPLEMWGGPECTLNRVQGGFSRPQMDADPDGARPAGVRGEYLDQIERTGHAGRVDDLDRFAALGLTALRYPVLWERVAPESLMQPDWGWTDERLERIRALGMRPIAGLLHHGSGPSYTSLIDPQFPSLLAAYAGMVARRYPWIDDYTPVNEPATTARFSGLYGLWFPHGRTTRTFVRALLQQVAAVALAMRAIREVNPGARLIQTEDCGRCFGTVATLPQVEFENHRRWLTWDLLTGRVDAHHPLRRFLIDHGATDDELDQLVEQPTPPQVVGLNYYVTSDRFLDHRLEDYPAALHGGNGHLAYADVEAVRRHPAGIVGHRAHLLEAWERYQLPVALTEVHLACTRDEQLRWLHEAWHGAQGARAAGAAVVAVTPWALLGSYDWDSLVTVPRGHYETGAFDVRSPAPRPTALAAMIQQLAGGQPPRHDALDGEGWWRRPERLLYARTAAVPPRAPARPLLLLGATGTLGQAFARIAAARGLLVHCAERRHFELSDPASLRELLAQVRPWAVVNATGYVRVDEAEHDQAACYAVNTTGAVNIAAACREAQVLLATFSSDLVFDGAQGRPYRESALPHPLSVYGASKAAAEPRIEALLPSALILRTSAFFGPWDSSNFVTGGLASIRRGQPWRAASDVVVSPTYVPDLVHATLDLLHDRERGIWHLCNEGALSWYELARAAARACGEPPELIEPVGAHDLGWSARRPAYSALSSSRGRIMRSTAEALTAYAQAVPAAPSGRADGRRRHAPSLRRCRGHAAATAAAP